MTRDMNTAYRQDLWNYGTEKLRCCGDAFFHFLRFAAVLLLMVVGVSGVKAQDYSGTYYLANNNLKNSQYDYKGYDNSDNFYLCPAQEYYNGTTTYTQVNEKPFLTTNKTRQTDESLWIVEKVTNTDYYTIKQKVGDNFWFITVNNEIPSINKKHRRRVHLEKLESDDLTDRNYFTIELITTQDGIEGYTIGCVDSYKTGDYYKYLNPAGGNFAQYTANGNDHGGIVGFYQKGAIGSDASGSIWFFEVPKPIINIDQNYKLTFTCANTDVTIHYTIDGGNPSSTGTDDVYDASDDIQLTEGVHTIKAIAVMNSGNTDYASGVASYIVRILNTSSYLIQNVECTDFYMIPGDVKSGNTEVNTSSLYRPTMAWNFSYAGSENGFLYYYIVNGSTGGYLYFTNDKVYMKASTVFNSSDDGYKFSLEQGYDADGNPDGFHIVPKAKISDNTYCIYKGGWVKDNTLANSTADAMKGSNNARRSEQKHTRWNFISAPEGVLPSSLTYNSSNSADPNWPTFLSSSTATKYFKIENVGTTGRYMCPPEGTAAVGTATTGGNDLAWYVIEAGYDVWQKYYYIVHASTGKYLKFNQTIPADPSSMQSKNSVLSLLDYESSASDRYQFVFAKSTIDGAYYIVPKGLEDATYNNYYALYLDAIDASTLEQPIKSTKNRQSDSYKWKFVAADLFCNDPVFEESEGKITITCRTFGAEIHYTIDGSDPTGSSTQYAATTNLTLPAEGNMVVKAIATISDGATPTPNTISSAVATMLYKPDITLSKNTYTYNGGENKPTVTAVSITTTQGTTTADATAYSSPSYSADVTNVGTPTITVIDADETDTWYIWNASATYTITRKAVNITADNATKTYNGIALTKNTFAASALEDGDTHTFTVVMTEGSTITNVGTQPNVIATVDGVAVTSGTATDVGNYKVTTANGTLTINPKSVTITADDATKTYNGTALTKNTFTVSALEDGDSHTFTVVMTDGSTITNVGTQPNVIATVDGVAVTTGTETTVGNYKVATANGTLMVTAKEVTITAINAEKEYDGTPLTESGFTTTALETGDTHTFTVVMTEGSTITNVGTQDNEIATVDGVAVTTGTETTVGNYKVTTVKGTLTVTKKTLTITADSGEKVYDGTPLTKNSYTNTDLLSGDVLESVTVTGTRTDAGESDNVPSAAVIKNANSEVITESYNVVYKNGKLKVTAKPVTITADSGEKEYDGTALTKNTYTHTALVEGHTITSVTITGSQTNVGTGSNVPSAAVIKKGETVVTANYNITYTNGTLKITPAAATVTADAKTKVYGDDEPTYTATVTGLKNNEAANVLTYTFSRATGENVGEYTITPAGEATQGNYTVTYATGKLTITKAAANVKADDKTKGYGDADPAFTATVTGLKNGDAASVLTYTFSRAEGENVNAGGYTITPAGNAEQGNYTVTYATGKLTITPKAINDGTNPAEGIDVDITYDGGTNYTVVVKQGEKTLVKDTDYELPEGSENQYDDADGNHVITIKGKDGSNYTGSFKATYIKLTFWDTTPDQTLTSETTAAVYCATQNLKVNESFESYYVTNLADNTLTLTKVEAGDNKKNYIPANQPLLLISDAATAPKGFTVKPYTDTDVVTIPASGEGSNLLKVVTDAGGLAVALTQVYIFSQGEFVLTKEGTMSKGKFYLENPNYSTPAPSRSIIRITTEGTTDINTAQYIDNDSQHSDTWYSIGGQKLNKKPTRKGLYLQNGKKVVIK